MPRRDRACYRCGAAGVALRHAKTHSFGGRTALNGAPETGGVRRHAAGQARAAGVGMVGHGLLAAWVLLAVAACGRPAARNAPQVAPPPPIPITTVEVAPELAEPEEPVALPRPPVPAPAAAPGPAVLAGDLVLRIGLLSDQTSASFPCCAEQLVAIAGDRTWATAGTFRVEPAPGSADPGVFRLQVGALRDPVQADSLAARLARSTGQPADAVLDAETGLYRVRVGRYPSREAAEAARRGLSRYGVTDGWVVSEGGGVRQPALRLVQPGSTVTVPGRWLAVENHGGEGVRVGGTRYRGRVLLYLNDRGTLNVVNELPLEEYLRGVVPRELGPEEYPELEALKAQAVAARTYTVRNLGEFRQEGYDICATPRCQVYGGMAAEHWRSDLAVKETRGQVLLAGEVPIDALYSSTCGGHTEDVGTVFPLKRGERYLRGVPCVEAGVARLGGIASGLPLPGWVARALVPAGEAGPAGYARRLRALAELAGIPVTTVPLPSLDAAAVRRHVATVFDLALDARLFVDAADLPYLVASPPPGWTEEDRRLAALFVKAGLEHELPGELSETAREELVYRLALYLRVLRRDEGHYLGLADGKLRVRRGDETLEVAIPPRLATFRQLGDDGRGADLSLVPGDRVDLLWRGGALLALVQHVHPQGSSFDRTSKFASWQRFKSDRELAALVRQRYPGFPYSSFEVVSRGVSGRVGALELLGTDGRKERVEGLAVRWTLDLPDTLFTAKRLTPNRGEPGWLFTGRGWGHGVGLCQVGAYGMAVRGHDYRAILGHYYRGVRVGGVPASALASSVAGVRVAPAGDASAAAGR